MAEDYFEGYKRVADYKAGCAVRAHRDGDDSEKV
jgi:hypothetical protein